MRQSGRAIYIGLGLWLVNAFTPPSSEQALVVFVSIALLSGGRRLLAR